MDRRQFIQLGALAGGALATGRALAQGQPSAGRATSGSERAGKPRIAAPGGQVAVTTPNGSTLPWKLVRGVKVGHLVAMPVKHAFAPGLEVEAWGYNGSTPGPTIEAVEGDRVRIYVTNRLPEPTTVHWHGLLVPNGMDGVVRAQRSARFLAGETFNTSSA